ncbi:MAG: response regulator transcription factor [Acidobacteria bacterium]|nr:response regulator transcription factor [Acidobacteriota bacterium]
MGAVAQDRSVTPTVGQTRIRAIVVDDSAAVRRAICLVLEGIAAVEVVGTARNGREGLEKAAALLPDLVVTDLQMPEMDGLGLTIRVRKFFPFIRVVMVTVFDNAEARAAAWECGADAFVSLDCVYEDLPREIKRVFSLT